MIFCHVGGVLVLIELMTDELWDRSQQGVWKDIQFQASLQCRDCAFQTGIY